MKKYQQALIDNLKRYRRQSKISQARFAELCDVSTGTIGNIECGLAKPSFDLLLKMADVLKVTPSLLLKDGREDANENSNNQTAEHLFLLELYARLKTILEKKF